jgi:hypothetical protein
LLHDTDRAERLTPITVLPGIRIIVDDTFTASIVKWVDLVAPDDFFAWNAGNRDRATVQGEAVPDRKSLDPDEAFS